MYKRKTVRDPSTDARLEELYQLLDKLFSSETYIITPLGGLALPFVNLTGSKLYEGEVISTSASGIILAPEDTFSAIAPVYQDVDDGDTGYYVSKGNARFLFNANGANVGDWVRISYSTDTVNTDTGKANSTSMDAIDFDSLLAFVLEARTGEGLATCIRR